MNKEVPHSYSVKRIGGYDNLCKFETVAGVEYDVRFKPSAEYIPTREDWREEVYEFVIEVASAPDPNHIPNDPAIAITIYRIIFDFFTIHHGRVILYICDDSDSRELARKRKFDNWFSRFGNDLFVKHDLPTVAYGPERYFASIFFRHDNPNRLAIITAFERLGSDEK